MNIKLNFLKKNALFDFHIVATLLFRFWNVVAGAITIVLMPQYLSPMEQGYFFTFASLIVLQVFFELGLNQILIQLVSHEISHLNKTAEGNFFGEKIYLDRLSSLINFTRRWYATLGILFCLFATFVGIIFFSYEIDFVIHIWILLVVSTSVNLWLSPKLAFFEGIGEIGQVSSMRLHQSILGYLLLWALLFFGAGLWAVTAVPIVNAIYTYCWINSKNQFLRKLYGRIVSNENKILWREDILPLQWKISVSWISGYFIFNLFTPMAFANQGPVEAGKLGMALSIFSAVVAVGMSWVNAKAPNFTMLISQNRRVELNQMFKALFWTASIFVIIASASVISLVFYMQYKELDEANRISSPLILSVIAVASLANTAIFCMATYMRAHREEPMLYQSISTAILVTCAVYIGSIYDIQTMMILYMFVCTCISLPWTIWLYNKYLKIKFNKISTLT